VGSSAIVSRDGLKHPPPKVGALLSSADFLDSAFGPFGAFFFPCFVSNFPFTCPEGLEWALSRFPFLTPLPEVAIPNLIAEPLIMSSRLIPDVLTAGPKVSSPRIIGVQYSTAA